MVKSSKVGRAWLLALCAALAWLALPPAPVRAGGDGDAPADGKKDPAPAGAKEGGDAPGKKEDGKDPAKDPAKEKPKADPAPAFTLKDVDGKERSLADFKGKIVVLEWISHGCPFVKKHYGSGNMQALQRKYVEKGVVWLSICSSAEGKEGNLTPKEWKAKNAEVKSAATAVLLDPDGTVGRAYRAARTPHMFVVDGDGNIAYQGAIDDRPTAKQEDVKGARNYVAEALDALLAGKEPEVRKTPAYG